MIKRSNNHLVHNDRSRQRIKPVIKLKGSEVAAAAGMHPYIKRNNAFIEKQKAHNAGTPIPNSPIDEKINSMSMDEIRSALKEYGVNDIANEEMSSALKSITKQKAEELSASNHAINALPSFLSSEIERAAAIQRGINTEKNALDTYQTKTGNLVRDRNSKLYTYIVECSCATLEIRSKVDGILEDGTIVETKCRQKKLFHLIPKYEKIQLEIYMRSTGTRGAILIENFAGEQISMTYTADDELWNDVCEGLEEYTNLYFVINK